jgi:pheromone a factor receptor
MVASNHALTAFSFIGCVISLIPLPWHLEAWNTGTCLYMIWTALGNFNFFVNSIAWDGNAYNKSPVWCDISARIIIMLGVAIPAASLCINRRLYYIATANTVTHTKRQKRRAVMADLAIGVGIPVLEGIVQYIPQGHRYNIFEDVGCFPWTYNTPLAFVFVLTWPSIISLVSAVYSCLTICEFFKRRLRFKELLSANSNLNSNRYFRLMCLAGMEIICGIPLSSWVLYNNIALGVQPWKGWENTHLHFARVDQIPSIIWRNNYSAHVSLELTRWSFVFCAFVFFGFFGFADEARKNYRHALSSVAKRVGYSTGSIASGETSTNGGKTRISDWSFKSGLPSLPVIVRQDTTRTTDSDSIASYDEKAVSNISISSAFNDAKGHSYSPPSTSGSSASSVHDRDYSPPRHPEPAVVPFSAPRHQHDIV